MDAMITFAFAACNRLDGQSKQMFTICRDFSITFEGIDLYLLKQMKIKYFSIISMRRNSAKMFVHLARNWEYESSEYANDWDHFYFYIFFFCIFVNPSAARECHVLGSQWGRRRQRRFRWRWWRRRRQRNSVNGKNPTLRVSLYPHDCAREPINIFSYYK